MTKILVNKFVILANQAECLYRTEAEPDSEI